jgi:hypothetical protein
MEETMKKHVSLFSAAAFAAVLFVLAACVAVIGPDISGPPAGKGWVTIRIDGAARALVPGSVNADTFTSYDLTFTPTEGDPVDFPGISSLTEIALDPGTYSLTLTAYTGTGDDRKEAASGTTAADIVVEEGETTPAQVKLTFKPGAGDGTLSFTITRPEDFALGDAQFVLNPLHEGGTTYGTDWLKALYIDYGSGIPLSLSSDETIASGYYEAIVTLSTIDFKAVKYDIVHIGAGQTTGLNWTFTEEDFWRSIEDIWLLGVDGQWETYTSDNKLTQQADGTFVGEGNMTDSSFRFSLEDTTTWGGDKDKPKRFQPENDAEPITLGTPANMSYMPNSIGDTTAWVLGEAGWYSFVVDPYAKTVTVTKTTAVERLPQVEDVTLTAQGAATWTALEDETNVASYSIQIWKGGGGGDNIPEGDPITVTKGSGGASYSYDLLSVLKEKTPDHYGISIKAIGANGYKDSPDTDNAASAAWQEVKKQGAPLYAWWVSAEARWVNVDGGSGYAAQLYKGDAPVGDPIDVTRQNTTNEGGSPGETRTAYDFTAAIIESGVGFYTFGVITKGNGYLILDSDEKKGEGDPYENTVAEGVIITFKPANESGSLSVTASGLTINKTAEESVTLAFGGTGFTDVTWVVDGVHVSGTETGYTLSDNTLAITAAALKLGGHSVTVYAKKDGVPWSPENPVKIAVTK